MKVAPLLLLGLLLSLPLLTQVPANDLCENAEVIDFGTPAACPVTSSITRSVQGTNVDATAATPYPLLPNCLGGPISESGKEVWYTFVAARNTLDLEVTGTGELRPTVVLFAGGADCGFAYPIDCFTSGNSNQVNIDRFSLEIGQTYYFFVAGNSPTNVGDFTLELSNYNSCTGCLPNLPNLTVSPPPINGTYANGENVNFCYTITDWDLSVGTTWLHAVTIDFGDGWDYSTFVPNPPPSCSGDGTWGWYESWTSCSSGQTFGPGFAYDSQSGLDLCGGSPNDGDPGNNWGDGEGPCSGIGDTAPPVSFCWSIQVKDIAMPGDDLSIQIQAYSDATTGSFTGPIGCGVDVTSFLAVVPTGCFFSFPPTTSSTPNDCSDDCTGSLTVFPNQGEPSSYSVSLFDPTGNLVGQVSNVTTEANFNNLCAGLYTVVSTDEVFGCESSITATVEQSVNMGMVDFTSNYSCEEELYTLTASVIPPDPATTYAWFRGQDLVATLPSFTTTVGGEYTLVATDITQCASVPVSKDITVELPNTNILASATSICTGESVVLTAQGGMAYDWGPFGQMASIALTLVESATYTVFITVEEGCVVEESIFINVEPVPPLVIFGDLTFCEGSVTILEASSGFEVYQWSTGDNTSTIPANSPEIYSVTATTADGCFATAEVFIENIPNPTAPTISCTTTQTSIEFQWDAFNDAQINEFVSISPDNGSGSLTDNGTYIIENLFPDDEVTITIEGCIDACCERYTLTCATESCNDVFAFIDPVSQLCVNDAPYALSATQTSDNGTGEYSWSGPGITSSDGIFDPSVSGPGMFTIELSYFEGICNYVEFVTIEVLDNAAPPLLSCESDLTSITISWPEDASIQGYQVTGPAGMLDDNTYTIGGLAPSTTLTITVEAIPINGCEPASSTITCATSSCPAVDIVLPPAFSVCASDAPFTLEATLNGATPTGTFTWSGDCLVDANTGTFDPSLCTSGTYTATVTYMEGLCSYSAQTEFTVNAQPTADFTLESGPICVTESIQVQAADAPNANYNWDFDGGIAMPSTGAGPFNLSWTTPGTKTITLAIEVDGCLSEMISQTIQVDPALDAPLVNCADVTLTSVSFVWEEVANATAYEVNVLEGPTGTLNGTTYTVMGLSPNEQVTIEVTAQTNSTCGSVSTTQSCTAFDCPTFDLQINGPAAPLCATGDPIVLSADVLNSDGSGTLTWSGNGITDATSGVFDPEVAGPGTHVITANYQEGPCPGSATITITVDPLESSSFVLSEAVLCTDQHTTITYTGSAPAGAAYDWDFDGGIVEPGTGQGPQNVRWTTPGTKTISLQVTVDGCVGIVSAAQVEVEAPLAAPTITCTATTSTLLFEWEEVQGNLGYTVNVLTGQTGTLNGTSYFMEGLAPEEFVTIQVTTLSPPPCMEVTTGFSCTTNACPDYMLDFNVPATEFCLGDAPVLFTGSVVGDNNNGTFSWSGAGINATSGEFNPAQAGVGAHPITLRYTEGPCSYTRSITIQVVAEPTADFQATARVCSDLPTVVTYLGTASANASFIWDFDGATVLSGMGIGPYQVQWSQPGTYTISLEVEENGCSSAIATQSVQTDPVPEVPMVVCSDRTSSSVTFSWTSVPGTNYTVSALTGQAFSQPTANTALFENLLPEESVTIEVEADLDNACAPVATTASCTVDPCPNVVLSLLIDPAFCLTEYTGPILLEAAINGVPSLGEGILFSGPGIVDGFAGLFDPLEAGEGSSVVTLTYTDGPCTYTETVTVEVTFTKTISNIRTICASDDMTYTVVYDALIFGESQTITSDPVPSGDVFVLEYATAPDCTLEVIEILQDCNCPGTPGTMSADQASCSPTTVSAIHNEDADIPEGSGLFFVLHDNAGNVLGTIFDQQEEPSFTINPAVLLDSAYYISPVLLEVDSVGVPLANGTCVVAEAGIQVAFTESIDLQISEDQFICNGQSVPISTSFFGDPELSWSPTTGLSCASCPSPMANPSETTTYTLTATNALGCSETVSTTIFVDELPFGELPATPDFICRGEPFEYCLPEGFSYTWTGPNNYFAIDQCLVLPVFEPFYAGVYTIEIRVSPTCTITETIELVAPPDMTVNFITPSNLKVCPTDVFLLEADIENAVEYRWFPASNVLSPNSAATLAFTQDPLLFTVQAADNFGCFLQETVFVDREIICAFDPDEYEPAIPLSELQSGTSSEEQRAVQIAETATETIQLFPNPTAGELTIQSDGVLLQEVALFDLHGQLLLQQKTETTREVLQLHALAPGTYWVKLIYEGGIAFRKVVVVRP